MIKKKNVVLKIVVILFISAGWVMANSISKTGDPFAGIMNSDLIFGNVFLFPVYDDCDIWDNLRSRTTI